MGTKDGLARFDGHVFKVFRNKPDDSLSLGDNFIRSLYIDNDDILYAGTRNGLYRYDHVTENFTAIYHTSEEIRDIKKDSENNLWFIAGRTLWKYNVLSQMKRSYNAEKYFAATSVCTDHNKSVWISTADGFLQKYNAGNDSFIPYNLFLNEKHVTSRWIEKIYTTNQQTFLVGTSNYGVKLFSLKDYSYKELLTYNPDNTGIFARDFVQTSGTEIWIATESGIFIYNTASERSINLKKQYNNPYSVSDNAVYTLTKDKEGGIWAGTYFGGINYFPRQYSSFEKYFPDYSTHSLSGNAVREICEDQYGNLWIGTEDAGLNRLDKKSGLFEQFKSSGGNNAISYPNIHGLLAIKNELWIGTFEHGLDVMDIKTRKIIKHYPANNAGLQMKSNFFVVLYQTRSGEIYAGTRKGLYRFDKTISYFNLVSEIPSECFIHSIIEDRNGTLWIGTLGNGLFCYHPGTGKKSNFIYTPQNKKGLTSNSVITIYESTNGNIWLGTEGGGLCQFNATDSSFINYSSLEDFPSSTVFKILEDARQKLWITTSKGLVSFDPASKKINVFTTTNGLLSNQFNYNSGYKDATGKMYFGSAKGLISFNPDSFITNTFIPPVYITGLSVEGKELQINNDDSPLEKSILYTKKVVLSYTQSSFAVDFAALTFTAPEMTEYMYTMEGLDKEWTGLKTNRKVYFTDLSPGHYSFKVKAANNSGAWTEQIAQLDITITPPFWKSTFAYAIYILLVALLIYYIFRNYHNRQNEKTRIKLEHIEHEKEKEIYQTKIEFFTNVAHEIKTPLTLIKAPMELIIKKAGHNSEIYDDLKIMEKNTDRLIELSDQLLDFRKIETTGFRLNFETVNITELLLERYKSFKVLAEKKNIQLTITLPEETVSACADIDSLHKIINNLLYNALTYGSSKAAIHLYAVNENDHQIRIEFSNDGFQIPAEMKEKIFEPFYRMKETRNKPGSGIGLALSRSLVEMHKGSILLKDPVNGMNTFIVMIPVYQNKEPNVYQS